jgi:hypothetical protein
MYGFNISEIEKKYKPFQDFYNSAFEYKKQLAKQGIKTQQEKEEEILHKLALGVM